MKKNHPRIIIIMFGMLIFGLAALYLLFPDKEVSALERRALAQVPVLSPETVFSGKFAQDMESYLNDQLPFRDRFNAVKNVICFAAIGQSDMDGGVYVKGGSAFKIETPLDKTQVGFTANKINEIYEMYLQGMNVYYAVVPDKSSFAVKDGYSHVDFRKLQDLLRSSVQDIKEIDLQGTLNPSDYYRSDLHWKQENIYPVAELLAKAMGAGKEMLSFEAYEEHTLLPFRGAYYGQAMPLVKPDALTYLTSSLTENAVVTGYEFEGVRPVYMPELLDGTDGYDVFLSGPQAFLTIEVPHAKTEKELILFRDSFGSSLAPYFIGAYSKITLVDLRYFPSDLLGEFVEFSKQDVLFLFSSLLVNQGSLLK